MALAKHMAGGVTSLDTGLAGLPYTVVRIRAAGKKSDSMHCGTGFFFHLGESESVLPLIISNKHVLCDRAWIAFDFASIDEFGNRKFGPPTEIRIDCDQLPIFEHPDPDVDLAAIPALPILDYLAKIDKKPYALFLSDQNFAPPHIEASLHAATSVLMVGFPNGIMDEVNNLPVVRRGILATQYMADYLGKSNFVVDIAAFGGSSGSPVFAFFDGFLPSEDGSISITGGPQLFFIGVLHSGPVINAEGKLVRVPAPTNTFIAQTSLMIHLGYCVKVIRLHELLPVIMKYNLEAAKGTASNFGSTRLN